MSLNSIPVEQVKAADLQRLVDDGLIENREPEFKEELPGDSADDKKDSLSDVSALANTAGGDLVSGVREERDEAGQPTGVPAEAAGVDIPNWDAERLRLDHRIRDGLDPHNGAAHRTRRPTEFDVGSCDTGHPERLGTAHGEVQEVVSLLQAQFGRQAPNGRLRDTTSVPPGIGATRES